MVVGFLGRHAGDDDIPRAGIPVSPRRRGVSGRTHHAEESVLIILQTTQPGQGQSWKLFLDGSLEMAISSPRATRSSRREKWAFASKEPTVSMRPRGLAGGISRDADECWVVAAAVTGRAGPSGQRMPRRRRVRWLPDDRLGGRIAGRGVQVALHSSGRGLSTHEKNPLPRWHPRGSSRVPCPPATLSITAGERRAQHRPPRKRPRCHRDDRNGD
jgi:hypothetical protein